MDRRTFVKGLVAGSLLAGGMGLGSLAFAMDERAEKTDRPTNFVFILTDDLGWGDLGCYGNTAIRTPCLDRLAGQGVRFTNFYASSPLCSPSRAAFLTGQVPARLRMHSALQALDYNKSVHQPNYLDPEVTTLPRLLQQAGYHTGHFGKWHLGGPLDPTAPAPESYGIDESRTFLSNGTQLPPHERHQESQVIVDETISFIRKHKSEPFFANVWIGDPHSPLLPSDEQMSPYEQLRCPTITDRFSVATQVYYSVVTDMDRQIGRLIDEIDALGLGENTVIVFTSDNGPAPVWGWDTTNAGAGSTGPFRGVKASLYEGGIRVPLIVRWPGRAPAGMVDDSSIIGGVDILPTFCAMAGVSIAANSTIDGEDVSSAFRGKAFKRKNPLMWEFRYSHTAWDRDIHKSPALAIRDERWKLLVNPDGSRLELYDFQQGVGEVDNVADRHPAVAERLSRDLLKWQKSLPGASTMPADAGVYRYPWPKSVGSIEAR